MHQKRLFFDKELRFVFPVEGIHLSKLFVNVVIVAFLCFSVFYLFQNPLFEFQVIGVSGTVDPERVVDLTIPELLRRLSFDLSHAWSNVLLIFVIVAFNILFVSCGHSILVEDEATHLQIQEVELSDGVSKIGDGKARSAKGMDEPLGLKINIADYWFGMLAKELVHHIFRVAFSESLIVADIQIEPWSIVDSSFSSRDGDCFGCFVDYFLSLCDFS